MAVPKAVFAAGALAAASIVGVTAWALWPTKEPELVAKMLARARMDGFDAAFLQCKSQQTVDDVQRCVAGELYPDSSWPPPDNAPEWQRETWNALEQRVRKALGLTPPGTIITAVKVQNPEGNMPTADYPELQGVPIECIQTTPWGYDVLEVLVPYGPVSDHVERLQPVIPPGSDAHSIFAPSQIYGIDSPPSGLGYDSKLETSTRGDLNGSAGLVATNTRGYGNAKAFIVGLAEKTRALLKGISPIYRRYEEGGDIDYPIKAAGDRPATRLPFPLSVEDSDIALMIDINAPGAGPWRVGRQQARQEIRNRYHKALSLLWCALYGRAQAVSLYENKQIYNERYAKTGMGVAPSPQPPKVRRARFVPRPTPAKVGVIPPEGEWFEPPPTLLPDEAAPPPVGIPLASKIMLWGSLATAVGAGGVYVYNRFLA